MPSRHRCHSVARRPHRPQMTGLGLTGCSKPGGLDGEPRRAVPAALGRRRLWRRVNPSTYITTLTTPIEPDFRHVCVCRASTLQWLLPVAGGRRAHGLSSIAIIEAFEPRLCQRPVSELRLTYPPTKLGRHPWFRQVTVACCFELKAPTKNRRP